MKSCAQPARRRSSSRVAARTTPRARAARERSPSSSAISRSSAAINSGSNASPSRSPSTTRARTAPSTSAKAREGACSWSPSCGVLALASSAPSASARDQSARRALYTSAARPGRKCRLRARAGSLLAMRTEYGSPSLTMMQRPASSTTSRRPIRSVAWPCSSSFTDSGAVCGSDSKSRVAARNTMFSRPQRAKYSRRNAALAEVSGRGGRSGKRVVTIIVRSVRTGSLRARRRCARASRSSASRSPPSGRRR
jgi:hypothetical protein